MENSENTDRILSMQVANKSKLSAFGLRPTNIACVRLVLALLRCYQFPHCSKSGLTTTCKVSRSVTCQKFTKMARTVLHCLPARLAECLLARDPLQKSSVLVRDGVCKATIMDGSTTVKMPFLLIRKFIISKLPPPPPPNRHYQTWFLNVFKLGRCIRP